MWNRNTGQFFLFVIARALCNLVSMMVYSLLSIFWCTSLTPGAIAAHQTISKVGYHSDKVPSNHGLKKLTGFWFSQFSLQACYPTECQHSQLMTIIVTMLRQAPQSRPPKNWFSHQACYRTGCGWCTEKLTSDLKSALFNLVSKCAHINATKILLSNVTAAWNFFNDVYADFILYRYFYLRTQNI